MTGNALKNQLGSGGSIEMDLMNLAMRRFQQLENSWAIKHGDTPWRNYIEADFFSHVLRRDNYLQHDYIRGLFVGDHIKHDIHRCSMFILPITHVESWSVYVFDFPRRWTTILDPMINNGDRLADEIQDEHRKLADELRIALISCIHEFFDGWVPKTSGWTNWFPKLTTGPWVCSSNNSGLFALHYARQWMGTKLQRTISPMGDDAVQYRMILLYESMPNAPPWTAAPATHSRFGMSKSVLSDTCSLKRSLARDPASPLIKVEERRESEKREER